MRARVRLSLWKCASNKKNSLSFLHIQLSTILESWLDSLTSQSLNNLRHWWSLVIGFLRHYESEVPELDVLAKLLLVMANGQPYSCRKQFLLSVAL